MLKNVLKYEPHVALFVPDEDALLFYKAIAKFSVTHLKAGGTVYVEINEALGRDICRAPAFKCVTLNFAIAL